MRQQGVTQGADRRIDGRAELLGHGAVCGGGGGGSRSGLEGPKAKVMMVGKAQVPQAVRMKRKAERQRRG